MFISSSLSAAFPLSVNSYTVEEPRGLVGLVPFCIIQRWVSSACMRLQMVLCLVCLKPLILLT